MPDYSRKAFVVLVIGASGYGKTTFCYRFLVNAATPQPANDEPAACIFIFDWKLEAEMRLGIRAVTTEAGCEAALASRVVIFNPHVMFPGDKEVPGPDGKPMLNDAKSALRWFAQWVFNVSQTGPGRKIFYVDELREFGNKFSVMPEINRVIRNGRFHGLQFVSSTQYPRDYNVDIRSGVTEWVLFNCAEPDDLDVIRPYFKGVDVLPTLQHGEFIAVNRDGGKVFRSRIF
jgi:hypothetical protein